MVPYSQKRIKWRHAGPDWEGAKGRPVRAELQMVLCQESADKDGRALGSNQNTTKPARQWDE